MKTWNKLLPAALALMLCAAVTACGQNSDAGTGSSESIAESSETAAAPADSSSAGDPHEDSLPELEIGSETTIGIGPMTAKPGDKKVPVSVQIWNNPGYASVGVQLHYNTELKAVSNGKVSPVSEIPEAEIQTGPAAENFLTSCLIGEDAGVIAFGCMASELNEEDGIIFTCYFDVPDNAEPGTDYLFECVLDSLNDDKSQALDAVTANGILRIE